MNAFSLLRPGSIVLWSLSIVNSFQGMNSNMLGWRGQVQIFVVINANKDQIGSWNSSNSKSKPYGYDLSPTHFQFSYLLQKSLRLNQILIEKLLEKPCYDTSHCKTSNDESDEPKTKPIGIVVKRRFQRNYQKYGRKKRYNNIQAIFL